LNADEPPRLGRDVDSEQLGVREDESELLGQGSLAAAELEDPLDASEAADQAAGRVG
jgi:hypothetical protein